MMGGELSIAFIVEEKGRVHLEEPSVAHLPRLHKVAEQFLKRLLDGGSYAYLWLSALTRKVIQDDRIANVSEWLHFQPERVAAQSEECFPRVPSMLNEARSDNPIVHELPDRPLEEGMVEQSGGAAERGDQAQERRGAYLSQPVSGASIDRRCACRTARRMGRSSLLDASGCPRSRTLCRRSH